MNVSDRPYRRIPAHHQRQFWTTVGAPTPGHNRRGNPSAMRQQLVGARVMLAAVRDCDLGRHIGYPRVVSPLPAMPAPLCGCHPMAVSYLRTFARTGPLIAVTMAKPGCTAVPGDCCVVDLPLGGLACGRGWAAGLPGCSTDVSGRALAARVGQAGVGGPVAAVNSRCQASAQGQLVGSRSRVRREERTTRAATLISWARSVAVVALA